MARYKDPVETAKSIFDDFLRIADPESAPPKEPEPQEKDPKKVAAGKKGGKAGGPARAASLTPRKRRSIAKKAAKARWAQD